MMPAVFVSIIIPLIVAPLTSWPLIGLLLKVDGLEKEMRRLATYDSLTGALTRQAFLHDVMNDIAFCEREQMVFSILALDLDKFKNINDEYGHPAGDEVLRQFTILSKAILRKSDLIGRTGGEEFAIMLPNTAKAEAYEISERLHSACRESVITYDDSLIKYTVSMGLVSSSAEKTESIEDLLKQADQALYLAKENGRDCTVIFDSNKTHLS